MAACPGSSGKEKLQLIEKGCPTPAVAQKLIPNPIRMDSSAVKVAHLQAFRFDSSSTVRITCHLELCKGNCKPTKCVLGSGEQDSWGRKKRDLGLQSVAMESNITQYETRQSSIETKRYKVPRFAQATTSLVIVDPLQQITDPLFASNSFAAHSSQSHQSHSGNLPLSHASNEQPAVEKAAVVVSGERCMNKWAIGSILGTLFTLVAVQSVVVSKQLITRMAAARK